ncbi:MAG: DMT family transporter [Acidimicrobiales bacterium]
MRDGDGLNVRPHAPRAAGGAAPGVGAATFAMVVWGLSAVLVVLVKQPGLVVALERLWLGVPFVGALLVISRRRLNRSILWRAVPGGILLCGDIALFFSAVKLTSIADATVIGALQPALVLLVAGPLFGERPRGADVAWTAVAIAGVSVVVLGAGGTGRHQALGDFLAFGSLCCWTGYWLVSKRARSRPLGAVGDGRPGAGGGGVLGSIEYTSAVMLVAAVVVVPVSLLSGEPLSAGTPLDWLWLGLMTVVPGSAHLVLNWAHRFVAVSVSSVIVSVNPIVAAGAATVVLHQSLDLLQVTGGLVAVFAAAIVARRAARVGAVEPEVGSPQGQGQEGQELRPR